MCLLTTGRAHPQSNDVWAVALNVEHDAVEAVVGLVGLNGRRKQTWIPFFDTGHELELLGLLVLVLSVDAVYGEERVVGHPEILQSGFIFVEEPVNE